MRRRDDAITAIVALLAAACSTLAPTPPEVECSIDADCSDDGTQLCESGVCRDAGGNPPLEYIGLDVQELIAGQTQFRAEVAGCDREVSQAEGSSILVYSVPRREIAQRLRLGTYAAAVVGDEPPAQLRSTFTLTQPSRFSRDGLRRQVTYDLPEESEESTVEVAWPRYSLSDDLPCSLYDGGYLVWQTQPLAAEEATPQALRYQLLAPPTTRGEDAPCVDDLDCCPDSETDTCEPEDVTNACVADLRECRNPFDDTVTYTYTYASDCSRQLRGRVISVDEDLQEVGPIPGASVTIRHADAPLQGPLGLPRLDVTAIEDREPQCDDAPCPTGLVCNTATDQCELPLAGLTAWTGTLSDASGDTQVDARVYTYCEDDEATLPLARSFDVSVTPPDTLGMPSVTLNALVDFPPQQAGQTPPGNFQGDLCVPALAPIQDVTLQLSGEPQELVGGYTCCDIDCLPRTAEDAEVGPPEARSQCAGATSGSTATYRVESPVVLDEATLAAWNGPDSPCVPVVADATGTVGAVRRSGACGSVDTSGAAQSQCTLRLPGADGGRTYALRIETPVGSVAGSAEVEFSLDVLASGESIPVELPERVLVRGRVVVGDCGREDQTDGDCGSTGAQVLAERLRLEGETVANTLGPYYHQVRTYHDPTQAAGRRDGAYVLPLDRGGVWVLTALPDSGTDGGPASFVVVDLRPGQPDPDAVDFTLEPGILVTIDVSSFDRRSQTIPLDTGTWRLDPTFLHPDREGEPDPLIDLGAPGECLSSDPTLGCRIRRLVGGSALPPTQLGQVRFTTRDPGRPAVVCVGPSLEERIDACR